MSSQHKFTKTVRLGDDDYEETLLKWLEEAENQSDIDDCDENECLVSEHDSSSEIAEDEIQETDENADQRIQESEVPNKAVLLEKDDSDEDENETRNNKKNYFGKNRYRWSSTEFAKTSRTPKHNIILQLPGLKQRAKFENDDAPNSLKVWKLLFTDSIMSEILKWTNQKIRTVRAKYTNQNRFEIRDVDIVELKCFLGLLIYTSVLKSNDEDVTTLFATDGTGRDIFRCGMNQRRFTMLLTCLRFDDPETRRMRQINDPAAPISKIFEEFVQNCQSVYSIGAAACIDEMLIGFRGRCKFRMYIPNKPRKYGIKLMCLTDARNNYFFNGFIYIQARTVTEGV